ncbi:hypothetical protein AGMMS49992_07750 [Clostridia bacterium]|nr:hypothetical protein AGMMS49992_07750 [Clostridia bacterium]
MEIFTRVDELPGLTPGSRGVQAVVFQQAKDQPHELPGSQSECTLVLVLVDLVVLEVIER